MFPDSGLAGPSQLQSYASELRRELRYGSPLSSAWREKYDEAIARARDERDLLSLAALSVTAAIRFDAEGLHNFALDHLRVAESRCRASPEASVLVSGTLALAEAIGGAPGPAQEALANAYRHAGTGISEEARADLKAHALAVRTVLLDPTAGEGVAEEVTETDGQGRDWFASMLMSWHIPYLLAMGYRGRAQGWTEQLRVTAAATKHRWRQVDAAVFTYANALAQRGEAATPDQRLLDESRNVNALWRLRCLALREATLRAQWVEAREEIARLKELTSVVSRGFVDGSWLFSAFIAAMRGDEDEASPPVPDHLSLLNLGAVLAGMEAVAVAGRQSVAVEWLRWVDGHLPKEVETALEWPVSAARVRGLLMARAGDIQGATVALREGVRWAKNAGYVVEQALGEVQLAELLAHGGRMARRSSWDRLRRDGTAVLEGLGLEPILPAYLVTRLLALSRSEDHTPLTPREVEVLSALAKGSTYKEAGLALDISWRTVRVHVTHVYEKLDVSRKIEAVRVGRELGII